MTQNDITTLAREAGFGDDKGTVHAAYQLEAFANLVAAAEREACAKLCDEEASTESEGEWMGCAMYLAYNIRARGTT